jgi:hypothetical protein
MVKQFQKSVRIEIAFDSETQEYWCVDQRGGLHLVAAASLDALRSKLHAIYRQDFDAKARVVLQLVRDPAPAAQRSMIYRG